VSSVVFDIETLGFPAETFDDAQQEYLLGAVTGDDREAEVQKLSLYGLTARVIAVAMVNPESLGGKVFFQSATGQEHWWSEDGKVEFTAGDETAILRGFWDTIQRYDRFITFNGRSFDSPFLMLRSTVLGVHPSRNLLPPRYSSEVHCDLLDQLTFYGATRKFTLDFYCRSLGIRSPKSEGITGRDLGPLFHEGKFAEIARYCLGDALATAELFKRWNEFLNIRP
jgi:DNA polymerase elongation subunit (family B)